MKPSISSIRSDLSQRISSASALSPLGRVTQVKGLIVRALLEEARVGDVCILRNPQGAEVMAEVVGIDEKEAILAPFSGLRGISALTQVVASRKPLNVISGDHLLGRIVDAFGHVQNVRPAPGSLSVPVNNPPPPAMTRQLVREPFATGVRAIDGMLTIGRGQRAGIFGGAGLGKSTLVSMLANFSSYDVAVIALIGERGREVREFWEAHLDRTARARTVLVVSTSDRPAVERRLAASTATAIAEGFRDRGLNVLLIVDSLTRLARAQREIGLAAGEPPVRRGYPPSMATMLAELLERAGPGDRGTITAFYSVLVEGELEDDPVAEEVKALLDGHIVLSRKLSEEGHFPAIDVLASRSRLMRAVAAKEHVNAADRVRALMAKYRDLEMLLQIGEYRPGGDAMADLAIKQAPAIRAFLRQDETTREGFDGISDVLSELASGA